MKRTAPIPTRALTRAEAFLAAVGVFRPTCTVERQAVAIRRRGARRPRRVTSSLSTGKRGA